MTAQPPVRQRRCKYCSEPAVPYGRQLCPEHTRRWKERRAKTHSNPRCDSCPQYLPHSYVKQGITTCAACQERHKKQRRQEVLNRFADRLIAGGES